MEVTVYIRVNVKALVTGSITKWLRVDLLPATYKPYCYASQAYPLSEIPRLQDVQGKLERLRGFAL
jgi:hypothetical protein